MIFTISAHIYPNKDNLTIFYLFPLKMKQNTRDVGKRNTNFPTSPWSIKGVHFRGTIIMSDI